MGSDRVPGNAISRRGPHPLRWAVPLVVTVLSLTAVTVPGVLAQDAAGEAFCDLLSPEEIDAVSQSTVEEAPGFGTCEWYASGEGGALASLSVAWNDVAMADLEAVMGPLEQLTVGGRPAWYHADEFEALLLIDVGPGVLLLDALVAEGQDARDPLTQLGEIALGRAGSLPEAPELAGAEPQPPADTAADEIAAAFCASLSAEEVTAALGGDVGPGTPTVGVEGGCEWVGTAFADFIYLSAAWSDQTMADAQQLEGTSLTLGGRPAWFTEALGPGIVLVELDQGLLALTAAVADGVDSEAALTSLAESVISRSTSLVAPPAPAPAVAADADLEGLFPESIGGEPLTIQSATGASALDGFPFQAAIGSAISAQGGDLSDLSVAFGITADYQGYVVAIRMVGLDAAAALPAVLEASGGSQEATELGGKSVTRVESDGPTSYAYAKDDVIWMVQAAEPTAIEILSALP
jgi:hypothetical protein